MARRLLVVLFATLVGGSAFIVDAPTSLSASSLPAADIRFRVEFGLSTDPVFVAAVIADGHPDPFYGVALTTAERLEIDRRVQMQEKLGPLVAAAQALPNYAWLVDRSA
jgi:hypothetical protein